MYIKKENLKKKTDEIVRLYKEGVMLTDICKLTTSSQSSVKKILFQNGIDYNEEKRNSQKQKLEEIKKLYNSGKSQLFIEKHLGVTRKTIRELLKNETSYRSKSEQQNIRRNTKINHNAFDVLNENSLYWVGMLYTDGHITKKSFCIELGLHSQDEKHLYKFRDFLKTDKNIVKSNHSELYRIRVSSEKIHKKLQYLGFTHQKSKVLIPHELLKDSRDFWRGCIDGDGGIYDYTEKGRSKTISLCGTMETILGFINFCTNHIGIKYKYPTKRKEHNLYCVSYYGEDAIKISNYLYKDATIYLDRKYKKYLEINNSPIHL